MPDHPTADLSDEFVLPSREEAFDHHRLMESAARNASEGSDAFEKLHMRAYELASQCWLNIYYGMRILEADEPDDRMGAVEAIREAKDGWRQYCRDREGVPLLDPSFGLDLIDERIEHILLRNYRARLENMAGNRNPDGSTELESYEQRRATRPDELDNAPICTNLAAMQKMWAVGEENARKSSIRAPDPATVGLSAGIGVAPTSPLAQPPSPPTPPSPPSGSRRRTT
jgi:hypothetical protein